MPGFTPKLQPKAALHVLLLLAILAAPGAFAQPSSAAPKRLVAYYTHPEKPHVPAYGTRQIPFKKLTHLIEVAMIISPAGDGSVKIVPQAGEDGLIARAHKAGVRVLACVQGEDAPFRKAFSTEESRARFVGSVKQFVEQRGYDGVDMDWEVPEGEPDETNNTLLMQALRDVLPAPRFLLSMATPSDPGHWGDYDFARLNSIVDFYNVMTYDFHGPWTSHAGHNSPLFLSGADPGHDSSLDDTVSYYLNKLAVPPGRSTWARPSTATSFPWASSGAPATVKKPPWAGTTGLTSSRASAKTAGLHRSIPSPWRLTWCAPRPRRGSSPMTMLPRQPEKLPMRSPSATWAACLCGSSAIRN